MKENEAEYVAFLERSGDKMHEALEKIRQLTEMGEETHICQINTIATECLDSVNADNY